MDSLLKNNKNSFLSIFSSVYAHQTQLETLNTWWDKVSLVGKINSLNVPQSLLGNMLETKAEFAELQAVLIENLLNEQLQQIYRQNLRIAQSVVDIPNRNLFERTADVGFLATNEEVVAFLEDSTPSNEYVQLLRRHLNEYAAKYSVYDDILLFDANGELRVQMTENQQYASAGDPVIDEALVGNEEYWEVCRYSPMFPNKVLSSLFVAAIKSPQSGKTVGVLCMSFKLEDEMAALFEDLNDGTNSLYTLLDAKGGVIASNKPETLAVGAKLNLSKTHQIVKVGFKEYLATIVGTKGYQGYLGLGWQGCALLPLAKNTLQNSDELDAKGQLSKWKGFSKVLSGIQYRAKIVTEDLDLVVLNGRIAAARSDADEFIPILEEIRKIGRQMQHIFSSSVSELMATALTSRFDALTFQASQAIDIMDRNLYERANDCRWWALTDVFIDYLANTKTEHVQARVREVLEYINSLYTVYSTLYVYDVNGVIKEVSVSESESYIGKSVSTEANWNGVLGHTNPQQYCVSEFVHSEYYNKRPTYIYNAALRADKRVVGGIGIVFDSEPQFKEMLNDVLGNSVVSRQGLFVDRKGTVISGNEGCTWKVGDIIELPREITSAALGAQGSGLYSIQQREFVVGYAVSKGYREYKTSDGYTNDVIAIILESNKPAE